MARKAARLERAGALTPRDRMWAAIRALASASDPDTYAVFSAVEVQYLANLRAPADGQVHVDSVGDYLEGLSKAQPPYVELYDGDRPAGRARDELALYALKRDVGIDAPRVTKDGKPVTQGLGNERMWAAMKALREFDSIELAQAASDAEHAVSDESAKTYIKFLERAGYVVLAAPAIARMRRARYRFVKARNTGPRAPLITRNKEVMDANTAQIVWAPENAEGKGGKGCKSRT